MTKLKQSIIALFASLAVTAVVTLVIPHLTQGQGAPGNQPAINVNVTNPSTAPALVRDSGIPLKTLVQIGVSLRMRLGLRYATQNVYTVPAGKRLMVEHVALQGGILYSTNALKAEMKAQFAGQEFVHPFDFSRQAAINDTPGFIANHPVQGYADAGTTVEIAATLDEPQGSGDGDYIVLSGTLSGYLVDAT